MNISQWFTAVILLFSIGAIITVSVLATFVESHRTPSVNLFADFLAMFVTGLNTVPRKTWVVIAVVSFSINVLLEYQFQPDTRGVVIKLDNVLPLYPDLGQH